jgi:hypothetical protein
MIEHCRRLMAGGNRHSTDGPIRAGDVIVSHVNGTLDLYMIATVLSAQGDLTLHNVTTGGSAAAYVKAPSAEKLMSRVGQGT